MSVQQPIISVITVVYNGADLLESTMQSIVRQSYPNIEYIIVDGASTDGTQEIIKKCKQFVNHWISEPDKGIYDAMNKGLKMATGDFVIFMNCGDHFHELNTLEKMMHHYAEDVDLLYGDIVMVDENKKVLGVRSDITTQKVPDNLNWKSFQKGQVVCHQAFLLRRSLAPKYILGNLCADIDWMIEGLKNARRTVNTKLVVAEFLMGGTSHIHYRTAMKDRYQVLRKHYGYLPNLYNHIAIGMRAFIYKITGRAKV